MISMVLALFIYFNILYFVAIYKKDFSIIDIAWGPSFFLIFLVAILSNEQNFDIRIYVLGAMIFLWMIRLSGYILLRSMKLKIEDYRYAQWRQQWGKNANFMAYFKVFILQGAISLTIGIPIYLCITSNTQRPFGTWLDYAGIIIWLSGMYFETVADYQKNTFKSDPSNKNKICDQGLWKYSRHPNYFGEALIWWGLFMIILNNVPYYYALISPLLMSFLLVKVSGVAMLERKYSGNADYEKYKKTTNAFIPWIPRGTNE